LDSKQFLPHIQTEYSLVGIYDTIVIRYFLRGRRHSSLVLDSTGAGDAFPASFLTGMLDENEPDAYVRLGNCEARLSLKCIGARGAPHPAHAA